MRALVKDKNTVAIKDIPRPEAKGAMDVLIHVRLAGLCRTDVFVAEGRIPCKEDVILGHEFSGLVEAVGSDVVGLSKGDRVTVMPVMPCGDCDFCRNLKSAQCQSTTMLGIDHDGAFAEYVSVPAHAVYKMPDSVTFKQGAYSEPVAASLSVLKAGIAPQDKGVIYGDNRFGQLIARILRARGFGDVTVYDPAAGAPLPENAFDFAVETMATAQMMEDLLRALRPGGCLVLKSRKHEAVGINFNAAIRKEITLRAVNYGDFREAIAMMADGSLQVDDLLGDIHPLEDFAQVFERSKTHESAKVFFAPGAGDVRDC